MSAWEGLNPADADAVLAVLREDTTPSVMTNLSEPSEADNKNVISVCPTCGATATRATGNCEDDCINGCAYPGQFSECTLGAADHTERNDEG